MRISSVTASMCSLIWQGLFAAVVVWSAAAHSQAQWHSTGSTSTYPSQAAALAFLQNMAPVLTTQYNTTYNTFNTNNLYKVYFYGAPLTVGPNVYETNIGGGPYSTEGEAIQAASQLYAQPPCTYISATPEGDWALDTNRGPTDKASRPYRMTHTCGSFIFQAYRAQALSCPSSFVLGNPIRPHQKSALGQPDNPQDYDPADWICATDNPYGGDLVSLLPSIEECGAGYGPSPLIGDPCDVASREYSLAETDYDAANLHFSRAYHSSASGSVVPPEFAPGWTHSYAAHLVIPKTSPTNTTPLAIVRPNGRMEFLTLAGGVYISSATSMHIMQSGSTWAAYRSDGSREIYDTTGHLSQLIDPRGLVTTLTYDLTSKLLSSVTDPFGHQLQFVYNSSNRLVRVVEPDGASAIAYTYDTNNNLTGVTYPDGTTRQYQYGNAAFFSNLTGVVDESNNQFTSVQYDGVGAVTGSQQAGGAQAVSIRYGANYAGATVTATDALGGTMTYSLTADQYSMPRISSISHNGLVQTYTVPPASTDPQERVTASKDANGNVTNYSYDADHLLSKTEAYGTPRARTTSYQYLATNSALPTLITEPLRTTALTYFSGTNNVQTKTITDTTATPSVSRTWAYTYDSYGRILTEDGPRTDAMDVTTYAYYTCTTGFECGQVQTVTDPVGNVTTYDTYNAFGQPLTITDPNRVVTTFTYDVRQRLTSRSVSGETTSFDYWPTGLLKKVTLPDASYLQYTYDGAHRLTQITDALGNKITYTLDAMGNRTAEGAYDPSGVLRRTHSWVINALNQLYQEINAAGTAAVTTTFGYDNNGNQTAVNAPLSRNTANQYDELNRLKQIIDPGSGVTQFGYDANDNLTSVTDPRSLVTSYTYSGFGDPIQQASPDTGTTTNTYDTAGNLHTSADARGAVVTYGYDNSNRPTSVSYALGGATDQMITFTYDAGTYGKGHLTGASDANHSLTWVYDALGRVTSKTQVVGTLSLTVGYGYTNGDLTTLTTPSGKAITYTYNSNHQVTGIAVNGISILGQVTYEPFGTVGGWTWGNGTSTVRAYDADGNVSVISSAAAKTYSYDSASRVTGIADSGNTTLSWTYGYDLLDRLTSASATSQSESFTYDENGNRLTQGGSVSSMATIDPASNRLISVSGGLTRTYGYDGSGNATSVGGTSFTYNAAGRMVLASNSSGATAYVYNAVGQRVRKSTTSSATYFAYDEGGHLIGEYAPSGSFIQEVVWLGDTPVATVRLEPCGLSIFYIHTDHLNTPRRITRRSTADVVWSWDSEPFGITPPNENPSGLGTFTFNLRLPGQYFDSETGLNQNYFRDYDPATSRYVESDPSGLGGGLNPYSYSGANPISNFDPLGLYCTSAGGFTSCSYPGGPSFKLPTPKGGFPDINASMRALYHKYDVRRALGCADPQDVLQALINNPTPGHPSPASPGGTPNDAPVPFFGNNPVTSYLTTDLNTGLPLVVNITGPGSAFNPGYVAREVINGFAHSYGEGLNAWQSPAVTAGWVQDIANQLLWGRQMSGFIEKAKQKCGCQQ